MFVLYMQVYIYHPYWKQTKIVFLCILDSHLMLSYKLFKHKKQTTLGINCRYVRTTWKTQQRDYFKSSGDAQVPTLDRKCVKKRQRSKKTF